MRTAVLTGWMVAAVVAPAATSAQPSDPTACFSVAGDLARLACYDKALARPSPEAPAAEGRWVVKRLRSGLTGRESISAEAIAAELNVGTRTSRQLGPVRLVVSCSDGKLGVSISFAQPLVAGYEGVPVRYRIGNAEPIEARWSSSQDRRSFGPAEGTGSPEVIRNLASSTEMYVELVTSSFGTARVGFKLDGASEAVPQILTACSQ